MTQNGKPPGFDERTSPWEFNEHDFMDMRGNEYFQVRCPASGRNMYTASECH